MVNKIRINNGVLSATGLKTDNPIYVGTGAGETSQHDNTIVLNAQETAIDTTETNGFYVAPITNSSTSNYLYYNTTTKEITYDASITSSSSSSLTIDTEAIATSSNTRTAQVVDTGIFYQNGTQLRVQYKTSPTTFQDIIIGEFDITNPHITMLGDNPANVIQGTTYDDAGATAFDNVDGDLTSLINTSFTDSNDAGVQAVDTSTAGEKYLVTYSVSDTAGNIGSAIRTVNVIPAGFPITLSGPYTSSTNIDIGINLPSGIDEFTISFEVNLGYSNVYPTNFFFYGQESQYAATMCSIMPDGALHCGHYEENLIVSKSKIDIYFDGNYHTIVFARKSPTTPGFSSDIYIDGSLIVTGDLVNGSTNMTPTSTFEIAKTSGGFGDYVLESGMVIRNIVISDTFDPPEYD